MKFAATLFVFSVVSLAAHAQSAPSIAGSYSTSSAVRMSGYSPAECREDGGTMDDRFCIIRDEGGNTLDITADTVEIHVTFGPGNMRDYLGAITGIGANSVDSRDASGCEVSAIVQNGVASIVLGDLCMTDLSRVNGATKK